MPEVSDGQKGEEPFGKKIAADTLKTALGWFRNQHGIETTTPVVEQLFAKCGREWRGGRVQNWGAVFINWLKAQPRDALERWCAGYASKLNGGSEIRPGFREAPESRGPRGKSLARADFKSLIT